MKISQFVGGRESVHDDEGKARTLEQVSDRSTG